MNWKQSGQPWWKQEIFNNLLNTHMTSSPGSPMDRPIHHSVGPRDSWGDTVNATEIIFPVRPRLEDQLFRTSLPIQAASLARASLLSSASFCPLCPLTSLNTTRDFFSLIQEVPARKRPFLTPCVGGLLEHWGACHLSLYEKRVCQLFFTVCVNCFKNGSAGPLSEDCVTKYVPLAVYPCVCCGFLKTKRCLCLMMSLQLEGRSIRSSKHLQLHRHES